MSGPNTQLAHTKIRCTNRYCESHTTNLHGKQVATMLVDLREDGTVAPFNIKHAQCNYCGTRGSMAPHSESQPAGPRMQYRFFVNARVTYRTSVVAHSLEEARGLVADCLMDSDDVPVEFIEWTNLDDPEFVEASPMPPAPAVTE